MLPATDTDVDTEGRGGWTNSVSPSVPLPLSPISGASASLLPLPTRELRQGRRGRIEEESDVVEAARSYRQ